MGKEGVIMAKNYQRQFEKDYQKLYVDYENALSANKKLKKDNERLRRSEELLSKRDEELMQANKKIKELENKIEELINLHNSAADMIKRLSDDNIRMKNMANKDSTSSSKPSSTDGYKNIPNNRVRSNLKRGGQKGHAPHTLKEKKLEEILSNDKTISVLRRYLKKTNGKKAPKYILDFCFKMKCILNKNKDYDKLNPVQYGPAIKSLVIVLTTECNVSYDKVVEIIAILSNNRIRITKATVVNWINSYSAKLEKEIEQISQDALNSYYNNVDDSTIKVNGKNYYQLCICNANSVLLIGSQKKNREAWNNTILSKYTGVLVKDGTKVFDDMSNKKAQCNPHITRYLNGAYIDSGEKHTNCKRLISLLLGLNSYRNRLIVQGITSFTDEQIKKYEARYDELIKLCEKDLEGESKIIYKDEINLIKRMKEKDKEEILYFLHDFKVPFSNNNAEAMQRGAKQRMKVGKFRSKDGADSYFTIRSFVLTVKKRKLNLFESIKDIFNDKPVFAK